MSDEAIMQGNREAVPYDSTLAQQAEPITISSCNTGQSGCSGVATFQNGNNGVASFTVWFRNGAGGRSNFVLQPRQTHGIHVQSGDTWSWISGSQVVPENRPRYWINVG